MSSFSDLLRTYVERSGITDAELARSVGVRRQTIFRWKEGLVTRPRYRDDVLRVAARLLLTPQERDALLLAAGFAPEGDGTAGAAPHEAEPALSASADVEHASPAADVTSAATRELPIAFEPPNLGADAELTVLAAGAAPAKSPVRAVEPAQRRAPLGVPLRRPALISAAVAVVLLLVAGTLWMNGTRARSAPTPAPTAASVLVAQPDETLLLVAEFTNYGSEQAFNVAGRIREALMGEINQMALEQTRVAIWPEPVENATAARDALAASGAAALIWGEYDSGRVRVNITQPGRDEGPGWVRLLSSPLDLAPAINVDLPQEVRLLALTTLGRLYREQGEYAPARTTFKRALDLQPADPNTRAMLHFLLATVLERGTDADYAAAIGEYSRVIPLRPDWVNARYNRGSAYLQRYYLGGEPDLLDAAIADFSWVLEEAPAFGEAFLNRGIAYYERNRPGDPALAYRDMTAALTRAPDSALVYFNRGLLNIRRDDPEWRTDLTRALQRAPEDAAIHNALCWGYVLDSDAVTALEHCERAAELDPGSAVSDTRGIAYAMLGRTDEAIAELEVYQAWLKTLPRTAYARLNGPLVEEWIAALRAGEMPFDEAMLNRLRG